MCPYFLGFRVGKYEYIIWSEKKCAVIFASHPCSWAGSEWGWADSQGPHAERLQGVLWEPVPGRDWTLLHLREHRVSQAEPSYRIHEKGEVVTCRVVAALGRGLEPTTNQQFWL